MGENSFEVCKILIIPLHAFLLVQTLKECMVTILIIMILAAYQERYQLFLITECVIDNKF